MDFKSLKNSKGQIWINCASGHYVLEDFANFDGSIFLRLLPFYSIARFFLKRNGAADTRFREYLAAKRRSCILKVHNCNKGFDLPNDSVDHILASHFLEHVYRDEAIVILDEFKRLLKAGGTLHVIVPDLRKRAKDYLGNASRSDAADLFIKSLIFNENKRPHITARFLEMIGGFGLFHRWMYDNESMKLMLEEAGFKLAEIDTSPSAQWRKEDNDSQVNLLAVKP